MTDFVGWFEQFGHDLTVPQSHKLGPARQRSGDIGWRRRLGSGRKTYGDEPIDKLHHAFGQRVLTPSGPGQYLSLPIAYVLIGVLASTGLLVIAHGRPLNVQGWVLIVTAGIFILWGLAFAWIGRRAYLLYELEVSQSYVKVKVAGASCLCILATAVGVVSGSVGIATVGFAILWVMRSQRQVQASASQASEFRLALADILRRAFLLEGVVMAATSLACGLFAVLVIDNGSRLTLEYLGGGAVLFLVGCLTTAMAVQQRPRDRSTAR